MPRWDQGMARDRRQHTAESKTNSHVPGTTCTGKAIDFAERKKKNSAHAHLACFFPAGHGVEDDNHAP
eukprot:3359819-Rhodomonas_salina.1